MQKRTVRVATFLWVLAIGIVGCAEPQPAPQRDEATPGPAAGTVHEYAYLEDEVQHLLAFLRGNEPLREDALADSATLYIAPEGGGEMRTVAARELRSPAEWRVGSYSIAPPEGLDNVRLTPGLHSHCEAVALETRYPELADEPHVGVRLAPDEAASCLQTWNATFVFNDDAVAPRLTAVVYDQWEW